MSVKNPGTVIAEGLMLAGKNNVEIYRRTGVAPCTLTEIRHRLKMPLLKERRPVGSEVFAERNLQIREQAKTVRICQLADSFGLSKQAIHQILEPHKHRARVSLFKAVRRGEISKPEICDDCGRKRPLHGHHSDYSKPLEVRWMCAKCHAKVHVSKPVPG